MSIILGLLVIVALVFGSVTLGSAVFGIMSRPKTNQLISKEDLQGLRSRDRVSEQALLQIAGNTAGNPVATAQAALDQRAATYQIKEIN